MSFAKGPKLLQRIVFLAPFLASFVLVGCGDSGSSDDPDATPVAGGSARELTPLEDDYVTQVRGAWALFQTKAAAFRTVFAQAWPTNERLFEALQEAGAGTAWVETLAAVQVLEPPPAFAEDHAVLISSLEDLIRIDAQIGASLEESSVVDFVVLNADLGTTSGLLNASLSPVLCRELFGRDGGNFSCPSAEPLPGGEYGLRVEGLILTLEATVGPRLAVWGDIFRPLARGEDFSAAIIVVLPLVTAGLETAISEAAALDPPEELRDDHALLLEYLGNQLALSQAVSSTVPDGGLEAFDDVDSQAFTNMCQTRGELSESFLAIAHGHFDQAAPCSELAP